MGDQKNEWPATEMSLGSISTVEMSQVMEGPSRIQIIYGHMKSECFCYESVGNGKRSDLILGCGCVVHYDCLVKYIRTQLADKKQLIHSMDDGDDDNNANKKSFSSGLDAEVGGRSRSSGDAGPTRKKRSKGVLCPYYNRYASLCKFTPKASYSLSTSPSVLQPLAMVGSIDIDACEPDPSSCLVSVGSVDDNGAGGSASRSGSGSSDGSEEKEQLFPRYFLGIHDLEQIVKLGQVLADYASSSGDAEEGGASPESPPSPKVPAQMPLTQDEVDKLKAWVVEEEEPAFSRSNHSSKKQGVSAYLRSMKVLPEDDEDDSEDSEVNVVARDKVTSSLEKKAAESQHRLSALSPDSRTKRKVEEAETTQFIDSITKACPTCGLRATHYHGHSCHHISPGGGCPSCKTEYCYACGSTAADNRRYRWSKSSCKCGEWSKICLPLRGASDQKKYLSITPFPHDTRCGCPICPDCRESSPCGLCSGKCDVCMGFVNHGPSNVVGQSEDDSTPLFWEPQTAYMLWRAKTMPVLERFHDACKSGDLGEVQATFGAALEVGLDANSTTREGYTALHCACFRETGHDHVVAYLIRHGDVDIHALTNLKHSAFDLACSHGFIKIFKLLVEHQLRMNREKMRKEWRSSFSSSRDMMSISVDCSQPPDRHQLRPENTVGSPMHAGPSRISHGASDAGVSGGSEASPADEASSTQALAIERAIEEQEVNLLWQQQKVEQIASAIQCFIRTDRQGFTPLHYACFKGHFDVVHVLCSQGRLTTEHVNARQKQGRTCVALATQRNFVDIVRYLVVKRGGDVNIVDATGASPLLLACYYGSAAVIKLFAYELLQSFEKGHADRVNKAGKAALHYACQKGNVSIARMLLDTFKANATLAIKAGKTPISFAVAAGHSNMINVLVYEYGVAVSVADVRAAFQHGHFLLGYSLLVQRLFRAQSLRDNVFLEHVFLPVTLAVMVAVLMHFEAVLQVVSPYVRAAGFGAAEN